MRGSPYLRRAVTAHLGEHLNPTLEQLATDLDLEPAPVAEWHHDWRTLNRVEAWPVLMVTAQSGINRGRIDFQDGAPVHQWDWTLRAWMWARGDDAQVTADRVELLAVATVETFTAHPGLGDDCDRARVVTEPDQALRISLSDIEQDRRTRESIAGAYVEFVVTMAEIARVPIDGTATDLAVVTELKET